MTISIRSSFMKCYCINVTRVSGVSERHRDALRRGRDGIILNTMHVPCKYNACIAYTREVLHKVNVRIL